MSIVQEIYLWSQELPPWQQDAIARLYADRELTEEDISDLHALATAEHGVEDPKKREPKKLVAAQVVAPPVPNRHVQIVAMRELLNVNALAEDQRIPIAQTGLTIIYGENGSGKSGYSRVLKKACRARDQREPILPDAKKDPSKNGPASAIFETLIDGKAVDLFWTQDKPAPEQLSELAIFDTHCARAYIDNQGDFSYVPYGLDILAGLVDVGMQIKSRIAEQLAATTPSVTIFASLASTNTKVGQALVGLLGKTSVADIEKLAKMAEAETTRLATLKKALAETDPKQKARVLRLRSTRFSALETRVKVALGALSEEKLAQLQDLVDASNAAKKSAALAAQKFTQSPDLLPGVGGEEWRTLFDAARAYAAISHPTHAFPCLPSESSCPLCQNTLGGEGVARLASFDAFISQAAETAAKDARVAAAKMYRIVEEVKLDLGLDEALLNELADSDTELAEAFKALQKTLNNRRAGALNACAGKSKWDEIASLPEEACSKLAAMVVKLQKEAKALEDSMDEKAKAAMAVEEGELEARRRLSELKSAAIEVVAKRELCAKLQACINSIVLTGISRKSTELSKTMATQEVANTLNLELKALNVHELKVVMKPASPQGKTQFKLALELPSGSSPAAILSEGEQRAIAIASFLTELKLGKGKGGIVFDDPVSSLDHRRRSRVASRLVEEAYHRQVIVFTHDIYFLFIALQEADLQGVSAETQCVGKGALGFGMQADRLPFDTLSTSKRVKELRRLQAEIHQHNKANEEAEVIRLTHQAYSDLRKAWERGVEEVLFQGVITRFNEGVSTQKLKSVAVEDSDYEAIKLGMTRSSKFSGHDPALAAQLATPTPDELKDDIEKLEAWRKSVEARAPGIKATRE